MAGWKVSQSAADGSVLEPRTQAPWTFIGVLSPRHAGPLLAGYLIELGRPPAVGPIRTLRPHLPLMDPTPRRRLFARYRSWAVFFPCTVPLLRALINYPGGDCPHAARPLPAVQHAGLAAAFQGSEPRC